MESTYPSLVYSILDLLHQNGGSMLFTDILNVMRSTPGTDTLRILEFMITEKLISGKLAAYERIGITPKGTAQLFAYNEQLAEKVDLPEQPPNNADEAIDTIDNSQGIKPRLPKVIITVFKAIGVIGTIAAAVVAVYEVFSIFF